MLRHQDPDPTPEEIARMTAEFRRGWTVREERRRTVGWRRHQLQVRVVETRSVGQPDDDDDLMFRY